MSWFNFWRRKKDRYTHISIAEMTTRLQDKGFLVVDILDDYDNESKNTRDMRDYLRKSGWIVMFLEEEKRKCDTKVCMMSLYNGMPHNKVKECK